MKIFAFSLSFLLLTVLLSAQSEQKYKINNNSPEWVQLMYNATTNVAEVRTAYEKYYQTHELIKNQHTQYYKRWLRSFSRTTEDMPYGKNAVAKSKKNSQTYLKKSIALQAIKSPTSEWSCIGPFDFDKDAAGRSYAPGAAHVYTVERSMSDTSILYAGTATAGLWKTLDGGQNWFLLTQNMMVNSIFSIEIDFTNPAIIYFASIGEVYKSVDGGESFMVIGDENFNALNHNVQDIVMHPTDNATLFLTSNQGFYKSVDAGDNWTQIMAGNFQEIELHPNSPDIIYTIQQIDNKTVFHKSIDGGLNFTIFLNNGWPSPEGEDEQKRVEIAVTPAAPDMVYALATGSANGGSGLYGIYISNNAGETWEFRCCGAQPAGEPTVDNINMMAWAQDGTDNGGQYYYDLALAVSPVDANQIHVGGVNQWISYDGGYTFTCPAKWSQPGEIGYVHADIHDIRFFGDELWAACDGGVFLSSDNGTTFNPQMYGIAGSDFWGFGASFHGDVMLGGAYHNGTLLKDEDTYENGWICTGGGDGVRGFVNPGNNRLAYDDREGRVLSGDRTVGFGHFEFDILPNSSYIIGESSDMAFDPRFYNTVYFGNETILYKTENNGQSFEEIHDFGHRVMAVEIPWSNPDFLYVATYEGWWDAKKIWKSTDSGTTWSEITPPANLLNDHFWVPWDITVSSADENILWAARTSQYGDTNLDGFRVYKTIDGGENWENITTATLNGEAITNIIHQKGTNGGVYLGTRRAVYYRNTAMDDWALFNNNLPARSFSVKLIPHYWGNKLRNATNRSIYEVALYEPSAPMAQISVDKTVEFQGNCLDNSEDNSFHFVDHSILFKEGATWEWTFSGGTPSTSTAQNPIVTYENTGTYDVSLTITDENGITSTQNYTDFIHIMNNDIVLPYDIAEDFETGISEIWRLRNANNSYNWKTIDIEMGANCESTTSAYINHFDINSVGDEAELLTPKIELFEAYGLQLHYDYAYARYGANYSDGFRIDISIDCGLSWTTLFEADGTDLQTVDDQNEPWQPTDCADWAIDNTIDLNDYADEIVVIRFVGINGWGNNFYLDNVRITGMVVAVDDVKTPSFMEIYPNPTKSDFVIEHNFNNAQLNIFSTDGKSIFTQNINKGRTRVSANLIPGVYLVEVTNEKGVLKRKVVIQ